MAFACAPPRSVEISPSGGARGATARICPAIPMRCPSRRLLRRSEFLLAHPLSFASQRRLDQNRRAWSHRTGRRGAIPPAVRIVIYVQWKGTPIRLIKCYRRNMDSTSTFGPPSLLPMPSSRRTGVDLDAVTLPRPSSPSHHLPPIAAALHRQQAIKPFPTQSSIPRGVGGPHPRAIKRKNDRYMLPRSPQSPTPQRIPGPVARPLRRLDFAPTAGESTA